MMLVSSATMCVRNHCLFIQACLHDICKRTYALAIYRLSALTQSHLQYIWCCAAIIMAWVMHTTFDTKRGWTASGLQMINKKMQFSKACKTLTWVNVAVKVLAGRSSISETCWGALSNPFTFATTQCVSSCSLIASKKSNTYVAFQWSRRHMQAFSARKLCIAKVPSGQLLSKEDVAHLWLPICLYLAIWPSSEVHVMQVQPSKLMPCRWNNHYTDWSVLKPQQQSFNGLQEHWI